MVWDFLTWKRILGFLVVIILGGLTSTISDIVFKPALLASSNFLVDIATLGLTSVRDGMYIEIAKGGYERASLFVLVVLMSGLSAIVIFLTGIVVIINRRGFLERLFGEESVKNSDEIFSSRKKNLSYFLVVWSCLSVGFFMMSSARLIYVIRAANHLEQLQRVVSPYINVDTRLSIQSRIAQIGSRSDYETVIIEMKKIAEANKLRIPAFNIN